MLNDCDELLATLKVRGMIPESAGSWTDAALLKAAFDEAQTWLLPLLINARSEFLVKVEDIAVVANQGSYRPNARVAAIRQVAFLRADGTEYELTEIAPPKKTEWGLQPTRTGQPQFYTFEDSVITLWPKPGAAGDSLRVRYHYRPNRYAVLADTCAITAFPGGAAAGYTRLAVSSIPVAMNAAAAVDITRSTPNFDLLAFGLAPGVAIATAGTSIDVLTASLPGAPNAIAIGDRVALANYTAFPNMPPELHLCAALRAASSVVKSKGDKTLSESLLGEAVTKERSLLAGILAPRSKGNALRLGNSRFRRW